MKKYSIRLEDQIDNCLFGLKLAKDMGDEQGVKEMLDELSRLTELRKLVKQNIDVLEEDKELLKEWDWNE